MLAERLLNFRLAANAPVLMKEERASERVNAVEQSKGRVLYLTGNGTKNLMRHDLDERKNRAGGGAPRSAAQLGGGDDEHLKQ